jgi:hypothetical protein
LICTKIKSRIEEFLSNIWPNMSDEMALRKLLAGNKVTVECRIKRKWENQLKKT